MVHSVHRGVWYRDGIMPALVQGPHLFATYVMLSLQGAMAETEAETASIGICSLASAGAQSLDGLGLSCLLLEPQSFDQNSSFPTSWV